MTHSQPVKTCARPARYDALDRPVLVVRFERYSAPQLRLVAPVERWTALHMWAQEHAKAECAARTRAVGHLVEVGA